MSFSRNRKARREAQLRRLAAMRAAKARRRDERIAAGWRPEPRFVRAYPLCLGVWDTLSGAVEWVPLKSVRDAARRLTVVLREYRPGLPI